MYSPAACASFTMRNVTEPLRKISILPNSNWNVGVPKQEMSQAPNMNAHEQTD